VFNPSPVYGGGQGGGNRDIPFPFTGVGRVGASFPAPVYGGGQGGGLIPLPLWGRAGWGPHSPPPFTGEGRVGALVRLRWGRGEE